MHFNKSFTTYRRSESGGIRSYSGTATITDGSCFFQPLTGEKLASLGIDYGVKAYELMTYESNVQHNDRVTVDSENYYVIELEQLDKFGITLTRCILQEDA